VIEEEPAIGMLEFDMSQLTDMPVMDGQDGSRVPNLDLDLNDLSRSHAVCPVHPGVDKYAKLSQSTREILLTSVSCLCHGLMQDWDVPALANNDASTGLGEPDYSRFEDWIPGYVRNCHTHHDRLLTSIASSALLSRATTASRSGSIAFPERERRAASLARTCSVSAVLQTHRHWSLPITTTIRVEPFLTPYTRLTRTLAESAAR